MKNILILVSILFVFTYSVSAQENYKSQIGLKIQNFQSYGNGRYGISQPVITFLYKKQMSKNKYRSFDIGFMASKNLWNSSLKIGTENHVRLYNRFDLIHGLAFEAQYSNITFRESTAQSFNLGIGYLLGVEYKLNKRWTIGASITPTIMTNIYKDRNGWSKFSDYYIQPNLALYATYKFN